MPRIPPSPVDRHIGARVRDARTAAHMSQTDLGDVLAVSFEQVSVYERGLNRITASTLLHIARATRKPVAFFFDDAPLAEPA